MSIPIWSYWEGEKSTGLQLCEKSQRKYLDGRLVALTEKSLWEIPNAESVLSPLTESLLPFYKADIIRLWLLKEFGGIWVDSDVVMLRSFEAWVALLDQWDFICYGNDSGPLVSNAIIASRPHGKVVSAAWHLAIERIQSGIPLKWGDLGQTILGNLYKTPEFRPFMKRFEHWRFQKIPFSRSHDFLAKNSDKKHLKDKQKWCPTAVCYHLTHKTVSLFSHLSEREIMTGNSFFSFLVRRAFSEDESTQTANTY